MQRTAYLTPRFAKFIQQKSSQAVLRADAQPPSPAPSATLPPAPPATNDGCKLVGASAVELVYVGLFLTRDACTKLLSCMHVRHSRVIEMMHVTLAYKPEFSARSLNQLPALGTQRKIKVCSGVTVTIYL